MTSLLILLLFLVFCRLSDAHSPNQLSLKYFPDTKELEIEIRHQVTQKYEHYVDLIEVRINNGSARKYHLRGQDSSGLVLKSIRLAARMGESIHVSAFCNVQGSLEGEVYLNPQNYYEEGAYFRSSYERPDYRGFHRSLEDFRYYRFRDSIPQPVMPPQPHNPVDSPKRRQLQLEEEIRREFHKNLEGN